MLLREPSNRVADAFAYALSLHRRQVRKGTSIPYLSHLMAVASLVMDHGGDEDQVIAALLHDGPEDQGGRSTLDAIRLRFGPRVAGIVEECSDTFEDPKPPWRKRKQDYIARLAHASREALLVSAADKLHNLRSIVLDYRRLGDALWARFAAGRDAQLWYYASLLDAYRRHAFEELAGLTLELQKSLDELTALAEDAGSRSST